MPSVSMPLIAAGIVGALVIAVLVIVIMTNADVNAKCGAKPVPVPSPSPSSSPKLLAASPPFKPKPKLITSRVKAGSGMCQDGQIAMILDNGSPVSAYQCVPAANYMVVTGSGLDDGEPSFGLVLPSSTPNPCASTPAPAGYTLLANLDLNGTSPTAPRCMDPVPTNMLAVSVGAVSGAPNQGVLVQQVENGSYVQWPASS